MGLTLTCDCGYLAEADDHDDLVTVVQEHASAVHRVELTAPVILGLLRDSRLTESATRA